MRIKEFMFLFTKSFNPLDYKMLVTRRKRDTFKYFIMLLFFSILLSSIFSLPAFVNLEENVESTLSKFDAFVITGVDIKVREPITLLNNPKTVLDLRENASIEDEILLITKKDLIWKKFKPNFWKFTLFETEKKPVSDYSDVIVNAHRISDIYWLVFIMLLPSLFFIIYILNFIKYSFIVLLITTVTYLILKLRKKKAKLLKILRAAVFSSTIMILLEISVSPLFNLSILPFILFLIIYIASVFYIEGEEIKIQND